MIVWLALLPAAVLIVYPSWVSSLVAVSVLKVAHQLRRPWNALRIYQPEHHATILPAAYAILPERVVSRGQLLRVPRQIHVPFSKRHLSPRRNIHSSLHP